MLRPTVGGEPALEPALAAPGHRKAFRAGRELQTGANFAAANASIKIVVLHPEFRGTSVVPPGGDWRVLFADG